MKEFGKLDPDTLMYPEEPKPINMKYLGFIRFVAEKEGRTISPPSGELALAQVIISDEPLLGKD